MGIRTFLLTGFFPAIHSLKNPVEKKEPRIPITAGFGIALEYCLNTLYETVSRNEKYSWHFHTVLTQPTLIKKFSRFR
jgi:hypothetical protein